MGGGTQGGQAGHTHTQSRCVERGLVRENKGMARWELISCTDGWRTWHTEGGTPLFCARSRVEVAVGLAAKAACARCLQPSQQLAHRPAACPRTCEVVPFELWEVLHAPQVEVVGAALPASTSNQARVGA